MTRGWGEGSAGRRTNPAAVTSNPLERAFEIARSGRCASVQKIRQQLRSEGFSGVESHLSGTTISKQLRALIKASRPAAATQDNGTRDGTCADGEGACGSRTGA